jgi:predicted metal-dependent phosphoesterase TrpH
MLKFQRTKLVNIINNNDGTLAVHGTLADHIYQIEVDMVIGIDDLAIRAMDGKWIRAENSECRRAIPFLKNAIGFKLDRDDFTQQVNKHVGRKSCPHFANLIIECCDAAGDAVDMLKFEAIGKDHPDLTFEEYLAGNIPVVPQEKPEARVSVQPDRREKPIPREKKIREDSNGFFVDLHIHTFPASQCSASSADGMLQEAARIGLDAVCVTDHNFVWKTAHIDTLSQKHGILVFNGNEITTDQGDMLVFGMHKDIQGIIKLQDLKQLVDNANGFIIAAHPFRGFLIFNTSEIGLTVEKAMQRPALKQVNALEVLNGKVTERENAFAAKVAAGLGMPATGGSDAHDVAGVGKYVTCFDGKIGNEAELVEALKSRNYTPCKFRKSGK